MRGLRFAKLSGTQAATVCLAFWGKLHVAAPLVGIIKNQSSGLLKGLAECWLPPGGDQRSVTKEVPNQRVHPDARKPAARR